MDFMQLIVCIWFILFRHIDISELGSNNRELVRSSARVTFPTNRNKNDGFNLSWRTRNAAGTHRITSLVRTCQFNRHTHTIRFNPIQFAKIYETK